MALSLETRRRVKEKIHPPSESTATFVKNLLLLRKKDYQYSMWKAWCSHLEQLGMKPPKYASFRRYVLMLVQADLIRKTTTPKGVVNYSGVLKPLKRVYYELVPENVDNYTSWKNPQVAVYGGKMRLGARRYRRRVLGIPPQPRTKATEYFE